MGYLAQNRCFSSHESATDYVMSNVIPAIDASGSLHHPVKQGDTWTYGGQTVQLSLPQCDPMYYFKGGQDVGFAIVILFAVAFGFKFIYRMIDRWWLSESTSGKDE